MSSNCLESFHLRLSSINLRKTWRTLSRRLMSQNQPESSKMWVMCPEFAREEQMSFPVMQETSPDTTRSRNRRKTRWWTFPTSSTTEGTQAQIHRREYTQGGIMWLKIWRERPTKNSSWRRLITISSFRSTRISWKARKDRTQKLYWTTKHNPKRR